MNERKRSGAPHDTLRMRPVSSNENTNTPKKTGEYRSDAPTRGTQSRRYNENDYSARNSTNRRDYDNKQKIETPYIVVLAVVITLVAALSVVLLILRSNNPELEAEPGMEAPFVQETDIPDVTPDDITDEEVIEETDKTQEEEPAEEEEAKEEEEKLPEEPVEEPSDTRGETVTDAPTTEPEKPEALPETQPQAPATEPPAAQPAELPTITRN